VPGAALPGVPRTLNVWFIQVLLNSTISRCTTISHPKLVLCCWLTRLYTSIQTEKTKPSIAGGVIMRRTPVLALLLGFAGMVTGCFDTGVKQPDTPANVGPATGDKEHTLEYWGKVREVMSLKAAREDNMQQVAVIVRRQADTVRQLHIDGVDRDLYVAALAVAQYQDKLLKAADTASYNPASLRADPDLSKEYLDASQHVVAAKEALKVLRGKLSARYGVQFLPIEDK